MPRKPPKKTGKPPAKKNRTPKKRAEKPLPFPITADDLREDPENPRSISETAMEGLSYGLAEFGDLAGITWNRRTGTLVTGHQRMKSLRERHGESLILNQTHGDNLEIVTPNGESYKGRVVDWDVDKAAAANLAANSPLIQGEFTSGVGAILDRIKKTIPDMVRPLMLDDLRALQPNGTDEARDGRTDPDAAPEATKTPVVQSGDLWICGGHRLLCGDSTKAEDVERLMGGEKAVLMNTDPPYGIDFAKLKEGMPGFTSLERDGPIANDELTDGAKLQAFLEDCIRAAVPYLSENPAFYLWHPMLTQGTFFAAAAAAADILIHRQIIWVKPQMVLTRSGMYHWKHELCFYGWIRGKPCPWYGNKSQVSVWPLGDAQRDRIHPTQKPTRLFEIPMLNHAKQGEICYEPFSGSGSQIIAAERLDRRAFAIEIEPKYVQVALQRWADFTGKDPVREDGTSFQDLVAAKP